MKPFSQACENNKKPILAHLKNFFADRKEILEVGSGTGQHAVYFGEHLPHLRWQCGDLLANHGGIQAWLDEARLPNVLAPVVTDADLSSWEVGQFDGVFSANTFHIMSWVQVQKTFQHLDRVLSRQGKLVVYGPFNYNGQFTSESNARFDQWLKQNGGHQGVRDFEKVDLLAKEIGLTLVADHAMPANNRLLCWVGK
jgi:cyclopropane fatty-acyl-phospholipid synthase-like methyltransferase